MENHMEYVSVAIRIEQKFLYLKNLPGSHVEPGKLGFISGPIGHNEAPIEAGLRGARSILPKTFKVEPKEMRRIAVFQTDIKTADGKAKDVKMILWYLGLPNARLDDVQRPTSHKCLIPLSELEGISMQKGMLHPGQFTQADQEIITGYTPFLRKALLEAFAERMERRAQIKTVARKPALAEVAVPAGPAVVPKRLVKVA